MNEYFLGDRSILKQPKNAFLSSRSINAEAVMRCYDWAAEQRDAGNCVISGFHSQLEKDALHFLLKGSQPVVMVLGRSLYKKLPDELKLPVDEGRLLIVSPVSQSTSRQSIRTAFIRNKYIIENAESVVFGSLTEDSSLYPLYLECLKADKKVKLLSRPLSASVN